MPRPPVIWPSFVTPSGEIAAIKGLYAHLTGPQYSVEAWEAGLLLYRTSLNATALISSAVARRWRFIACHECVLELFHLRARLERIQSVKLRACPSLRPLIDTSRLRSARKRLDEYFPDIEALRHAVAHKGENEAYADAHAPDGKYALTGFSEPDKFSTPYQGRIRYLDMTDQSLERIIEVVTDYFAAFELAAAELERQGHLE